MCYYYIPILVGVRTIDINNVIDVFVGKLIFDLYNVISLLHRPKRKMRQTFYIK